MNQNVISIYKSVGQTPLEAVIQFKGLHPEYENEKIGYAGRLDPMADGLLLLLIGDENKNKQKYLELDKKYTVTTVFGVSTDTYDLLGIVKNVTSKKHPPVEVIIDYLTKIAGDFSQEPPPFSSYRIKGKPLFYYSKNDLLVPEQIPHIKRTIFEAGLQGSEYVSSSDLQKIINKNIDIVNGDFRQSEIKECWINYFDKHEVDQFLVVTCAFKVSTGTYIRSIVNQMGEDLSCPAFALSITRTQIGDFILENQ